MKSLDRMKRIWFRNLGEKEKVLHSLPKGGTGVEVGTEWGDFAEKLLKITKPKKLYLVDPYKAELYYEKTHQVYMDQMYHYVYDRFAGDKRIEVRRELSCEFFNKAEDESFSWVYIDGSHKRTDVWSDLIGAFYAVEAGGIIAGDDLTKREEGQYQVLEGLSCFLNGRERPEIEGFEERVDLIIYDSQYILRKK